MTTLAPIVLFVYNRPDLTLKTLSALKKNELASSSNLYIFSDAAKDSTQNENVNKVREIVSYVEGFNNVKLIKADENKGLANSVIEGVTKIIEIYGKVIVLEDDLITSKFFLNYMNDGLEYYKDSNIWSISGYTPKLNYPSYYSNDVYAVPRACSWGWATWEDKWKLNDWLVKDFQKLKTEAKEISRFNRAGNDMYYMLVDQMNGHIDSWAIRWCYNQFQYNLLTIYPTQSYIVNFGMNNDSTHGSFSKNFTTSLIQNYETNFKSITDVDSNILREFSKIYNMKLYNYIGRGLKKIGLYKQVKKISKKMIR